MKKNMCVLLSFVLLLSLSGCSFTSPEEDYIPGVAFDPMEYDSGATARYENRIFGIILDYPEKYKRVGNFDLDGYVSFEGNGNSVSVYVPDTEHSDILSVEEYVKSVLELQGNAGSGITKYGKSSGYKVLRDTEEGKRIDFIVKGVDAFYRFAFSTDNKDFTEDDETFQEIVSSIRIDDGVYNRLIRMSNNYTLLLKYAVNMDYITEANYVNHCLNNYDTSKTDKNKNDAIAACERNIEALEEIASHVRDADEGYDDLWAKIVAESEKNIDACKQMEQAIRENRLEDAQKIAKTGFTYKLSERASEFISAINVEISEY